ncbi:hypothetical protein PABG_01493 [Paracoccidioides brasiliensis Pb03]|nr:hypothetical protein PABG_01493 [Paracoccidioides brasiliensis Pb03]
MDPEPRSLRSPPSATTYPSQPPPPRHGAQVRRRPSSPRSPAASPATATSSKLANGTNGTTGTHSRTSSSHAHQRPAVHVPRRHGFRSLYLPLLLRAVLLFAFGVAYGTLIMHLHDNHRLTPMRMENITDHGSWVYMVFWGLAGVALGGLLPWFDGVWEEFVGGECGGGILKEGDIGNLNAQGDDDKQLKVADWNSVVRSTGAFVGIAFAIRKLPWQSTLQVSLTLALVNPFLWYLIDRSKPGFMLSTAVGLVGMVALLGINSDVVPAPGVPVGAGGMQVASQESIAVVSGSLRMERWKIEEYEKDVHIGGLLLE